MPVDDMEVRGCSLPPLIEGSYSSVGDRGIKADDRGLIKLSRGDLVVGDIFAAVVLVVEKQLVVVLVDIGVGFLIPKSWVDLVKQYTWEEGNCVFKYYYQQYYL